MSPTAEINRRLRARAEMEARPVPPGVHYDTRGRGSAVCGERDPRARVTSDRELVDCDGCKASASYKASVRYGPRHLAQARRET
jgi:hypothetical protein